jgi:2-dehydro-3-deoxy-D-arabinonate dehydratase
MPAEKVGVAPGKTGKKGEQMRYYQFLCGTEVHVGAEVYKGVVTDLTSITAEADSTLALLKAAHLVGVGIDDVVMGILDHGRGDEVSVERLCSSDDLLPPIFAPEVWAFGVTYMDSMRERQAESGSPDVYAQVYNADRPEAFFKATADRLVSPGDALGIRGDSEWDVPEPELAFVLYEGEIVGYTIGNDMSSRSIEGANPLYLPQAKVYDRSCSIGPCLATPDVVGDAQTLDVGLQIERDGRMAFEGSANTSLMKRDCDYLADWLQRHNQVPNGTTVCTGTGTIPPPEFTLADGDLVRISIDKIGTLVNPVIAV